MDNLGQVRVSVVIPTRNRSDVLDECLERLGLEADRSEIFAEALVVDTSTEATNISLNCHPYLRVRYRYDGDKPFSLIYARNVGLREATADIVAYIDDDSFVLPGWLEALVEPYQDPRTIATGGRVIYHPWSSPKVGEPVAILDLERDRIRGEWDRLVPAPVSISHLQGCNFSVRKPLALEIGGFDPAFTGSANLEETDFFVRLGRLPGRIVFHPGAVVEHRAAPRADGIERTLSNYTYRKSAVRNRLYLLRKHASRRSVLYGLYRQLKDLAAGIVKLVVATIVFTAASLVGIFEGLCTPVRSPKLRKKTSQGTSGVEGIGKSVSNQ